MESYDSGLKRQDANSKSQSRLMLASAVTFFKFYAMLPFKILKKVKGLEHQYSLPTWLDDAVFYQIYPQSFNDTNGDGIGDIEGIIEKLDYFNELGVNVLWLNPVFDSPFKDAGYDVRDYKKVAERYGSNDDLKRLFSEAKKKNIRVILDLVAGHCSDEHEWFKASINDETTVENDKFIWTPTKWIIEAAQMVKSTYKRKGFYRKNFYDCQPALNYGYGLRIPFLSWEQPISNPGPMATRQALKDIIEYWMDMGSTGFRVDMAASLVKRDIGFYNGMKIWQEIRDWFEQKWPEGVLVSEWGFPDASVMSGFHIDFMLPWLNKGAAEIILNDTGTFPRGDCYFDLEGRGSAKAFIEGFLEERNKTSGSGLVSIPTSNHDFQRPACGSRDTDDQLKALMLYNLTFTDLPVIYYGDEIGLKYLEEMTNKEGSRIFGRFNRAGSRTPMQWSKEKNAGFSTADKDDLYLPIDPSEDFPNVNAQVKDEGSLFNFTKKVLEIKKASGAFSHHAKLKVLSGQGKNEYPLVYLRETAEDKFLMVINPSKNAVSTLLSINTDSSEVLIGKGVDIEESIINCASVSYAVIKLV